MASNDSARDQDARLRLARLFNDSFFLLGPMSSKTQKINPLPMPSPEITDISFPQAIQSHYDGSDAEALGF